MPRRLLLAVLLFALVPFAVAQAHLLDHPVPTETGTAPPLSTEFNSGGENAEWELLATIPTFNPHSDLDFFQQKGVTYASVGNLGIGPNGGGQVIFRMTDEKGEVDPAFVSNHPSASCLSDPSASLGLQHDVEATPKASTIQNTEVQDQNTQDTKLLLDATDAVGRCHDQGAIAQNAPRGGLEIIDVSDVENPKEIGLTSHIGQAHTVNVDPRRPHIAYVVSSDQVGVNANGERANETGAGRALDGFEIVDLRTCLEAPLGTIPKFASLADKRNLCRPEVYRYRYPAANIALGHTNRGAIFGCHELEVYPDDRLTCGGGAAAIVFDIKGLFNDNGTPDDFTDDKVNGTPLPCAVRDSSTTIPVFRTGAKVTDCVVGLKPDGKTAQDLGIPEWIKIGSPSALGIKHVGSAFHMGRELTQQDAVRPDYPATEDIDFDHELEFTDSRKFVLATDERGGGVLGGAQCSPGADLSFANGGIHAYAVNRLQEASPFGDEAPKRAEQAFKAYARTSEGKKAIFRAPIQTGPQGSFCTAHVFQQIPGENRIFMGWYSQGTQVIDFTEKDGKINFKRAGYFIPENANQWVSSIFKIERNPDGTTTYYGATGDGIVGDAGRNGVDIYKVTLPAAPLPPNRQPPANAPPGTNPNAPITPGVPTQPTPQPGCAVTSGFMNADVAPEGRGLRFDFTRQVDSDVRADIFQSSRGRDVVRSKVVRFSDKTQSFTWNGRKKGLRDGTFVARLRINVPGRGVDTRRFSLQRKNGRFKVLPIFKTPVTCGLLTKAELSSNAFGGRSNRALGISFRLDEAAQVTAVIKRGDKTVKTFTARTFQGDKKQTLRFKAKRRGAYTVALTAERGQAQATATLVARRI
jgi:hypothetical protein